MTQNTEQELERELTLEEAFEELDALAERLENKDISLDESFQVYQKGMALLKQCSEKIDLVEKKMLQVNEDGQLTPF